MRQRINEALALYKSIKALKKGDSLRITLADGQKLHIGCSQNPSIKLNKKD